MYVIETAAPAIRPRDVAGALGLVESKVRRQTGRTVSVYDGKAAGLDTVDGTRPYSTVCEDHGHIVCHTILTLARAHAASPLGWCETCMPGWEA